MGAFHGKAICLTICAVLIGALAAQGAGQLRWSTYLGGSGTDHGSDIAVDRCGNVYVVGYTYSTSSFPTTPGAYDTTLGASTTGYLTKFSPTGALLYSTLLGGSNSDDAITVAVDDLGRAVVGGSTGSTDFPTTPGAYHTQFNGPRDGFVTKLNATGSALIFSTLLGGNNTDRVSALVLSSRGEPYVTGSTESTDFPVTPGAYGSGSGGPAPEGFVTHLNDTGSSIFYSTLLGGTGGDYPEGIAVDAFGRAYVAGHTDSSDFPTTPGAFQTGYVDNGDAFVTKLNAAGSDLVYSTFLGGDLDEEAHHIALDKLGRAVVCGYTRSGNFPVTPGAYQTGYSDSETDGFVAKLNGAGSALIFSTLLGGSLSDAVYDVAVDRMGFVWIGGYTYSPDFPTTPGAYDTSLGGSEAFAGKLSPSGSLLLWCTFLGGSGQETGRAIALDGKGSMHLTGNTTSSDFPVTPGAFDTLLNGAKSPVNYDAFVTKLRPSAWWWPW